MIQRRRLPKVACANEASESYKAQRQRHHTLGEALGPEWNTRQGHTNIQYPAESNGWNEATISEALYPQTKGKPTPCPDEVFGGLPEEDGEGTTHYAGHGRCEHKHTLERFIRGIDCWEDAKFDDKNKANKRQRIKSDEEERSPERPGLNDWTHGIEESAHHLFLWPQNALGRPVKMRIAPRTPNAGEISVDNTMGVGDGEADVEAVGVGSVLVTL